MTHVAHGDPVGGLYSCVALLTALVDRQRTGDGHYVNVSMVESLLQFTTPVLPEFQLAGRFTRRGNRHPVTAPQGMYRAAGDDAWLACTVANEAQFTRLADLIGRPDLATDGSLHSSAARQARHDEMDAAISCWTSRLSA